MRTVSKIEHIGKRIIFYGLILFLFIPLIQNVTHFKRYIYPLDGAFYLESDTDFSWETWFNGNYTTQKDKYIKENFGLRNYYFRLICQVNFSLFKKANASYIVIGKENYLYETAYIDAYYGRDYIGQKKINNYVKKLKEIQDTLEKQHKLILVAFAPGKASFYPEYIPENYRSAKTITNHDGFVSSAKENHLNYIDFYEFFQDQKSKSKYPLYPQLGIHWSNYGSLKAIDSIIRYTEKKLNVDLVNLEISDIEWRDSLKGPDDDAVKSLNLFRDPGTFKMAYPRWKTRYDSTKHDRLNLLVISDSFWWYIYSTGIPDYTFGSSHFWYYNEEIYPESYNSPLYVSQVDYATKIRQADVILIMHSEATLYKFGGGFVDMCHETFFHPGLRKEQVQIMKGKIRATPEWFKQVNEKAQERNITVDSMLTLDAIYSLDLLNK